MINLTPRLSMCADMCPQGGRLIDVGCDHGYLAIHIVGQGRVHSALACDLRVGPLEKAKANINRYQMADKIDTLLTNGLDGIVPTDNDIITICGMGGDNIADILSRAPWTKNATVIAQPMTHHRQLREFLKDNGYKITEERLGLEQRRIYVAMSITGGEYEGEAHMQWSHAMERDPLFGRYLKHCKAQCQKRYDGAGDPRDGALLALIEEKIKCL